MRGGCAFILKGRVYCEEEELKRLTQAVRASEHVTVWPLSAL